MKRWLFAILALGLGAWGLSACAPALPSSTPSSSSQKLANPAATYCEDQGFRYESRQDEQGNAYGVCVFDDGTECDAWAYFRGECGQGQAKNLVLDVVEAAGLEDTVRIEVLAPKTASVDPDVSREPRLPGMEVILTIDDPQDIQALLEPLHQPLQLIPPMRCPTSYELHFQKKDGETVVMKLGLCGLYGDQDYWKGMTIRPPEAFVKKFNALLGK